VIKEADKGNAVVILDREYYRDKTLDMLKDGMYYEETDKKADQKTYKMITKFKNSRSSLIKLGTSQHSGLSIMSIKWLNR
jgi:hypothetical protein